MPYSPVTITGYNANPPADDGSAVATNEISWAGIKAKIGDPLKTAIDAIQVAIDTVIDTIEADIIEALTIISAFQQTLAPTGWTKLTTHDNKALRLITGTVSTGGSASFTSVFTARTIAQANLPNVTLVATSLTITGAPELAGGAAGQTFIINGTAETSFAVGGATPARKNTSTGALSINAGTLGVGGNVPLGGSGTALDFALQYVDVISAQKD